MSTISFNFPLFPLQDRLLGITVVKLGVNIGEQVDVVDRFSRKKHAAQYILDILTLPATEVPEDILSVFGVVNREQLVSALSQRHGTGLPLDVTVFVYELSSEFPERDVQEEIVELPDDDVLFTREYDELPHFPEQE